VRLERLAAAVPHLPAAVRYAVKRAVGAHLVQMHELPAARAALREALEIVEWRGRGRARDCAVELAIAAYEGADYDEARRLLLQVAASAVPGSDQWAFANGFLGNVATAVGGFTEADARYDMVADVVRRPSSQATYLRNRAFMSALAGDAKRAADYARQALAAAERGGASG
jgi:tetratricopeptide (TPR) repeat protein